MVAIKIYELGEIPAGIEGFDDFQRWSLSDEFPKRGRIDFIDGHIEVDMAPDRINSHSLIVSAIVARIWPIVDQQKLGQVLGSQTRIVSKSAGLSCEPDIKVVFWESLKSGRVKYVESPRGSDPMDLVEVDGGPDIVVEVISPSSVEKDIQLLPPAFFKSGVREFWLVDARGDKISFQIFRRGKHAFENARQDRTGFIRSDLLGRRFRLIRQRGPVENTWVYDLEHKA